MILVPDLAGIIKQATSDAERLVARLLSAVEGPDDAVAFHSIRLRSHPTKQQAEADFVILWRGVVVLVEVKGGGVQHHNGKWWSIDRFGDPHPLRESPMQQAESAMHALTDILREDGVGWFERQAVVITPDIESPPAALGWEPTHWLDKNQMSIAALRRALDVVVSRHRDAPRGQTVARVDDLRTRLFGEFTRMPVMDALRGVVIEEQNRATKDQAHVLASLARNPRIMVLGGAGTGKSLALVEAAKQEAQAGRSVLITYRSPLLSSFFMPRTEGREIDVAPFDSLVAGRIYDVVMIDEAQDLMTAEDMDRLEGVVLGGRSTGRWRMFLDPNNQAHVDGRFEDEVFEIVADEALLLDLDRNVRNTSAVVHMVQSYLGADVGDPGIVHGAKVEWRTVGVRADVDAALTVAREIVDGGARAADIWIICTNSDSAPWVSAEGVTVTSPRFAKGLEAEHVIVCELPEELDDAGMAALYVAVTRPRVTLYMILSDADNRQLQKLARSRMVKA